MHVHAHETLSMLVIALLALAPSARAQSSHHALRFHGTGAQTDRALIAVDDDAPGPDASAASDVGASSFTIEFWLRGELADNPSPASRAPGSYDDARWRDANVVLDRGVIGSGREFGISVAGGRVRFGTGTGDGPFADHERTLEGSRLVLDGSWHHVACVRDAGEGTKLIYVDGLLDVAGAEHESQADLSYPDGGVSDPSGPFLVIGAEKHDAGGAFDGYFDELRIWHDDRRAGEIGSYADRVLAPDTDELAAAYRFEEGSGTSLADSSAAGCPAGTLASGVPGTGEWTHFAVDPTHTAPVTTGALPAGFQRDVVAFGFSQATVIAVAPDGRVLIGTRTGAIRVVESGALLPTPMIQLDADIQDGERGLVGLTLDPSFATNGYLYAYYTTHEPKNRVSRFTVAGNTAELASEMVVWENPDLAGSVHHGGAIDFGPDGRLYIATGDQFDSANSQNLAKQHGKILRVNSDGSIPSDNPFVGVPGAEPAIWARGLRNPFRIKFDALTGILWISDVGGNVAQSWEELNVGAAGANFGWPDQEGESCAIGNCAAYALPKYDYRHDDPLFAPGEAQAAIIVGPIYRGSVFPAQYHDNLFIADYANRWIRRLVFDGTGTQVVSDPLFQLPPTAGSIVDLRESPDGALYVLTMTALSAIRYTGTTNEPPIAEAHASPVQGPTPLDVQFEGSSSVDPDASPAPLVFNWNFGDHATSAAPDPLHTYAVPGVHYAVLTVNDGASQATSAPIAILAGNPPSVTLAEPLPGTTYHAGDTIAFSGSATDVEDGALPPSAFTWQVLLVHAEHVHPFYGPISGVQSGSFTVPVTGHDPANTHYMVVLDVVDSDELPAGDTRSLVPITAPVVFTTEPPGIPIFVEGEPRATPLSFASLVGYHHVLRAQAEYTLGGVVYRFHRWAGAARDLDATCVVAPAGSAMTAIYRAGLVRPVLPR